MTYSLIGGNRTFLLIFLSQVVVGYHPNLLVNTDILMSSLLY